MDCIFTFLKHISKKCFIIYVHTSHDGKIKTCSMRLRKRAVISSSSLSSWIFGHFFRFNDRQKLLQNENIPLTALKTMNTGLPVMITFWLRIDVLCISHNNKWEPSPEIKISSLVKKKEKKISSLNLDARMTL